MTTVYTMTTLPEASGTKCPDTRTALIRAIDALLMRGDDESVLAARTLKSVLMQRGCSDLGVSDHDRLPETIDVIVFG